MNKKRLKRTLSILLFTIFTLSSINTVVFAKDTPPEITSENGVLIDGTTGEVLYSKNSDEVFPPASTTKVMTALLTLEHCKIEDKVLVGKNPPFADGSRAGIRENEELTVKDLLYGLLFVSGNDCANALAEHVGGSLEGFVTMMNNRAKELGLINTNFVNPNGLYDPLHRSTVKDLALIMRELVKHPEYSEIATDNKLYNIIAPNTPDIVHPVSNEIQMVWKNGKYYYDGVEGGKTGYTTQSLFSYVVSAKRNGQRLIVALHSSTKSYYADSIKLLDYGFKNFELAKLYSKGDKISDYEINDKISIPLLAADDFFYVKEKGSNIVPQISINKKNTGNVSFSRGDTVLDASITLGNENIGKLKLVSGGDYKLKTPSTPTESSDKPASSSSNKLVPLIILGFILTIIMVRIGIVRKIFIKSKRGVKEWNSYR